MACAAVTGGKIELENVMPPHMVSLLWSFRECGCDISEDLLVYDYYLLNNDELLKADKDLEENDHLFDKEIYNFVS